MVFPTIDVTATGTRIRDYRMARHITVEELADYMMTSAQAIYKWQRGECLPSVDNLLALSRIFDVKIDDIICGDEREGESPPACIYGQNQAFKMMQNDEKRRKRRKKTTQKNFLGVPFLGLL